MCEQNLSQTRAIMGWSTVLQKNKLTSLLWSPGFSQATGALGRGKPLLMCSALEARLRKAHNSLVQLCILNTLFTLPTINIFDRNCSSGGSAY